MSKINTEAGHSFFAAIPRKEFGLLLFRRNISVPIEVTEQLKNAMFRVNSTGHPSYVIIKIEP